MSGQRFCFIALLLLLLVCAVSQRLLAQTNVAQLTGVVRDTSGALIQGAALKVTDMEKGTSNTAASDSAGIYRFPALAPGRYEVECSRDGFKTFRQEKITLQVGQTLSIDVSLEPGVVSQQVVVTTAPSGVEATTGTVGQVVTARSIEGLPLNVRDPMALVGLTPGVVFGSNFGNSGTQNVGRNFFKSDFYVGGGRSGSQEIILDGAPNTTGDVSRAVIDPPVDAVQEFKVQANSYDAQFGRTSGGVLNIVTKSGTNEIHGSAYDFERNSVFDANNFFSRLNDVQKTDFARHQFGGVIGGPVLKNRLFLFGDYEGLRQSYPTTSISTVATEAERAGDFSGAKTSSGALIKIYDPLTTTSSKKRTQFEGNIIPSDRINPISKAVMGQFYPLPNTTGNTTTNANNYIFVANQTTNSDKYDIRLDFSPTEKTRYFGRFSRQVDKRLTPGTFAPAESGSFTDDTYTQIVLDVSHVFSPNLFVDIGTSFTRGLAVQQGGLAPFDPTTVGFPTSFTSQIAQQLPSFSMSDTTSLVRKSAVQQQHQPRNTYATHVTTSYLYGKHSLKFGVEWRSLFFNEYQNANSSGTFSFTRGFTQGPTATQASNTGGFGFASFLLGYPGSGTALKVQAISSQGFYYAGFLQDDMRVFQNLTLNVGLRYEIAQGTREKYNRIAYFDPNAPSLLGATVGLPNLQGAVDWVGQGNSKDQQATDYANVGPRFGFSWEAKPGLVVRGGYGVFFLPRSVAGNGAGALETSVTTNMNASQDGGLTPADTLSDPFPDGITPTSNDRSPLANVGSTMTVPTHDFKSAYVQLFSFGIQKQLPAGIVLEGYYWGNKGTHMPMSTYINQLPNQYLALGSDLTNSVTNPFHGVITSGTLAASKITLRQSLLPYPQYLGDTGILQILQPIGSSNFNAGTVKVEKRISDSLTFLSSFTYQKNMDNLTTPYDAYNRAAEYSLTSFDVTHQFLGSAVADLPFGRGRHFGRHWNAFTDAVLGGWRLSGIVSLQSGFPVSVSRSSNLSGNAQLDHRTISEWFDTSVLSVAPTYTFGNVGPVLHDVRTDPIRNFDTVLAKKFPFSIKERTVVAQFRLEAFNAFNHTQFAAPNGTITSTSFGTVTSQANNPRQIQLAAKFQF